jgi:hypothetical protein
MKYIALIAGITFITEIGIALATTVTRPLDVQLRTQVKIMEQNPQGKWIPVDQIAPTNVRFEASLLEMVSGDAISTGFTLQTTTKKGKPFKARLLGKAIIDFNPVTGQLDGQMTYEVEYDGHVSRVPAAITTESRDTPDGKLRGVRADNLFGKKPTKATVVSANRMTLPGGRNLLLVCTENYKVTPKGK